MEQLSVAGSTSNGGTVVRKKATEEDDMAFFEKRYQERVGQIQFLHYNEEFSDNWQSTRSSFYSGTLEVVNKQTIIINLQKLFLICS